MQLWKDRQSTPMGRDPDQLKEIHEFQVLQPQTLGDEVKTLCVAENFLVGNAQQVFVTKTVAYDSDMATRRINLLDACTNGVEMLERHAFTHIWIGA